MITLGNSKLDRMLWHVGLSWWHRMKIKLWFHFLPKRILCLFLKHQWGEESPIISDGPLNLPPKDRDWFIHGVHKQCKRCASVEDVEWNEADRDKILAPYIEESQQEWDDPNTRAILETL